MQCSTSSGKQLIPKIKGCLKNDLRTKLNACIAKYIDHYK